MFVVFAIDCTYTKAILYPESVFSLSYVFQLKSPNLPQVLRFASKCVTACELRYSC